MQVCLSAVKKTRAAIAVDQQEATTLSTRLAGNGIKGIRKKARLSVCAVLEEYLTKNKNGFSVTEIRFLLSEKS